MQWHVEAERLGCLRLITRLELDRGLDRQIARFFAAQDAIEIRRRATPQICCVGAMAQQAAAGDEKENG